MFSYSPSLFLFIGVKIPVSARVLCAAVPRSVKIDRGYMQDLSSVARSCTYVRSSFWWKYAREPQFGAAKVYEPEIR